MGGVYINRHCDPGSLRGLGIQVKNIGANCQGVDAGNFSSAAFLQTGNYADVIYNEESASPDGCTMVQPDGYDRRKVIPAGNGRFTNC